MMKVIECDMMRFFPNATKHEPMSESEGVKYPYTAEQFSFDKERHCYVVNGGEVFCHTCPSSDQNNRPNACEYCMFAATARFYIRNVNGKKAMTIVCKGLNLCKACSRLYKKTLVGKSLFFRDSEHFKTHEKDHVTSEKVYIDK